MFIFLVTFLGAFLVSQQMTLGILCIEGLLCLGLLGLEIMILKNKSWILISLLVPLVYVKLFGAFLISIITTFKVLYPYMRRFKIMDTRAIINPRLKKTSFFKKVLLLAL